MIRKSVGMQLRDGRESKHYSLDDLESLTGIKSSYLLSMEMDQFSLLPSKSYEISYIKKYAEVVDLDHESLLRDYHIAVAEKQERAASRQEEVIELDKDSESYSRAQAGQHGTSHRQTAKTDKKNLLFLILSLLVLLVLLAGLFFVFWNRRLKDSNLETARSSQISSASSSSSSSESSTSSSSESPSLAVTPSVDGVNLAAHLSQASKPVDLVFSLTEGAADHWFAVSNSNYESGATLSQETPTIRVALSEDTSETLITLGNTSGIKVTVNGQELDLSSLLADTTGYITLTIE
ncbi:helix-turn-helix domain-containing protein [Streptococcus halotolerans]|uniref:helix-turn-helix domain-containing protein n=1 Tax=Streptococcus halotolerans TaxID=1814128 RepID=UPI0007897828|nr:helix-turn-helix domain-containing protein [Streptococcus halotolerans]